MCLNTALATHSSHNKINIIDILLWGILSIIFPLCSGNIGVVESANIFIYITTSFFIGDIFSTKLNIFSSFPSFIVSAFNIVFGSVLLGFLYLIIPSNLLVYSLLLIAGFVVLKNKKITINTNSLINLLCIAPLFLMLFYSLDWVYATQSRLCKLDGDNFFHTAAVESLKTNHNFFNAVYHQGIGINYQALALLPAAHIAKFAQIKSQVALWGVYFRFLPIASFAIVATCITQIFKHFFAQHITQKKEHIIQILVVCMLLFLAPLHILNLLKRDFAHTLFSGVGYVLPLGSPGFAMSMLFSAVCLFFIITVAKPNWFQKTIFIAFLCIIVASKVALFFPLSILLGAYALLQICNKNLAWFYTLLLALPCCLFIYKLTLAGADGMASIVISKNGFFFDAAKELAPKYHIKGSAIIQTFILFAVAIFMFLNLKFTFLIAAYYHFKNKLIQVKHILIATLVSFAMACLPGFILNIYGKDESGKVIYDGSFDTLQFLTADIFLISIIAIVFVLYFMFIHKSIVVQKITKTVIFLWMITIAFSFCKTNFKPIKPANQSWYVEVESDFNKTKPNLMATMGNENYSGQTVCGIGVHPWFCTGLRTDGDGYTFTKQVHKRNILFQQLFDTAATLSQKINTINYLKNEGVDYIVANPFCINKINKAVADAILIKVEGTKWFYKLK